MPFQAPITIAAALERMARHDYVLPAIQREFVWGPDRICKLFDSLMRGYPIGSFLFWKVNGDTVKSYTFYDFVRTYHAKNSPHCPTLDVERGRDVTAVLDGQQRLTALNIGLRGSHAERIPRMRYNNPLAYPTKRLYINLLARGDDDELELAYHFRFLTPEEASARDERTFWFLVSEIRNVNEGDQVFDITARHELPNAAGRVLFKLYEVVKRQTLINYFEEEDQSLEKVLNIFIRVNSGAVPLSFSDLLLSIATSQWRERDAREEIHALVDDLNRTGLGFNFDKNSVLKSGLVLLGKRDIRFKVDNFDRHTMLAMEEGWDDIERALRLAAQMLSDFGFSSATLPASSVIIPLAHYAHLRRLDTGYLRRSAEASDRNEVRRWLLQSVIKGGIWGSGLDTLLGGLRAALDAEARNGFPRALIEREMARQGKALRFDPLEVDDLLDLKYGGAKTFALLALLYPGIDVRNAFHVDHVYPRSRFTAARLRNAGIPEEDIPVYLDRADRLANLQLLEGTENVDKRAAMPSDWVRRAHPDPGALSGYLARNDLGDLPPLSDFLSFYDRRRALMRERLISLLGIDPSAVADVRERTEEDQHGHLPEQLPSTRGPQRRDIAAHITSAFAALASGAFLTVQEIRNHRSDEYGAEFPSAGAISARLFPVTGRCSVPGVEPGMNERGVRGARKL
ncbi:DUF262 domain-containing protein [Micromonospora endolithica]|uniref:DUF262 domain-containing protein n=1 Tax=Micromonospora endolithica TaxID=230091 RepID=A0A3A9ZK70_9ACTN|nr:DUF262 domain-containing protein [Micromonospora endolithica]RKN47716.1 DUF262 domain-containing protein [Micromonospora endolithica]TWJ21388.1 uncharacterized protein DUF262 [Micromonospora endolithica]